MHRLSILTVTAFISLSLHFSSCKDDDHLDTGDDLNPIELSHMPLDIGNYWVYSHFKYEPGRGMINIDKSDSVTITKDTVIRGKKYYKLEGTNYPFSYEGVWLTLGYLRDSAGYLVDRHGEIVMAEQDYTTVFEKGFRTGTDSTDTAFVYQSKMIKFIDSVHTPAGVFKTLAVQKRYTFKEGIYLPKNSVQYTFRHYAKDVGKVMDTYFWIGDTTHVERRLARYHVH